jgi:hypothetical protein
MDFDDPAATFSYLGETILNDQILDFANIIRDHFPTLVQNNQTLTTKIHCWSHLQNGWPVELSQQLKSCSAPIYCQEDIVVANNAFICEQQQINKDREEIKKKMKIVFEKNCSN